MGRAFRRHACDHSADELAPEDDDGAVLLAGVFFAVDFLPEDFFAVDFFPEVFFAVAFFVVALPDFLAAGTAPGKARATALPAAAATTERVVSRFRFTCSS